MGLDPHTQREDLNVFPAISAYIVQKGSSWGHTFLIFELNFRNHHPSMFFWIPADESSSRAQSGQSTLLLIIVSVPKKLSHPLAMFGGLLCFVCFGYPRKRRPIWFHSNICFTATQWSCAFCLGLPWNVFNGTAALLPVWISAAWTGWHMKKG